MGVLPWVGQHWFELLQTLGIVAGLLFTAVSLRSEAKARRVDNLMVITKHHREIWTELYQRPALSRVISADVNLATDPMTREEDLFIRLLILHLNSVYHAIRHGVLSQLEGLQKDVRWFFSLPLPKVVWKEMKPLQDVSFAQFVEACCLED